MLSQLKLSVINMEKSIKFHQRTTVLYVTVHDWFAESFVYLEIISRDSEAVKKMRSESRRSFFTMKLVVILLSALALTWACPNQVSVTGI